ncbi:MAG: UDP-4-amino-4,6-dideoxy-N-acetyl-beta-L-altrosamine transaminase [Betaproteobacteria bacterium]|jgi:UDP-4-amino-4,6-dideoxy-N-acetyl-beta-L-altrosamine transaminase
MIQIPYGRQDINEDDIAAVEAVLKSDWLTQGPAGDRFEEAVRGYCGAGYAVAMNSATSALHLACRVLGLGPGDSMWTSPITFVASANAARYCGASVDFVDIDERTYNMSVAALADKLQIVRKQNGVLPKIVMPVHFAGQSCDMREIGELAEEFGFSVVEDASHAIGGRYLGRPVGDCRYSSITVFSFHPVKIVTTGEGGMAVTNNAELADRMRLLRSHGVTRDPAFMKGHSQGAWYYEQVDLGYNYRLTDIQAALGTSQMQRIDGFVRTRHAIADRYARELSDLPVVLPWQNPHAHSAYHLFPIRIDRARVSANRGEVFSRMRNGGIGVNVHYIPVHTQPYYRMLGFKDAQFPVAERYYADAISLPLFSTLDETRQRTVVRVLREALA